MRMWPLQHDTGAKTLLRGTVLPALPAVPTDVQALADVQAALDNLINHPNTAPFISRLLIQRLVTSNPTPAYIGRVSAVFANNGSGVRGDLFAVVRAILTDTEARDPSQLALRAGHGKLKEPFLRAAHVLRAFNVKLIAAPSTFNAPLFWDTSFSQAVMGQYPLSSPSVFNFYSPDYDPPGVITAASLVGPEFQIMNAVTGIAMPNAVRSMLESGGGTPNWTSNQVQLDPATMTTLMGLATSPAALLDEVDLLLTHGMLSRAPASTTGPSNTPRGTYDIILTALNQINTTTSGTTGVARDRVRMAIYLVSYSPDFCIAK
jgi:uncharacterized protein (DUF1800 family)